MSGIFTNTLKIFLGSPSNFTTVPYFNPCIGAKTPHVVSLKTLLLLLEYLLPLRPMCIIVTHSPSENIFCTPLI